MARWTEYVCEPTDAHGDIIDPQFSDILMPAQFGSFPDAVYIDRAIITNYGDETRWIDRRVYEYIDRTYRDGRVVRLNTVGGHEPVEVE